MTRRPAYPAALLRSPRYALITALPAGRDRPLGHGGRRLLRRYCGRQRHPAAGGGGVRVPAGGGLFGGRLAVAVEHAGGQAEAHRPPGVRYRNLSTGSRLAYLEIPASGPVRPAPVIFVGGGPGGFVEQSRQTGTTAQLGAWPDWRDEVMGRIRLICRLAGRDLWRRGGKVRLVTGCAP